METKQLSEMEYKFTLQCSHRTMSSQNYCVRGKPSATCQVLQEMPPPCKVITRGMEITFAIQS